MSDNTNILQDAINRLEDGTIHHLYNSFLVNILLLGRLFLRICYNLDSAVRLLETFHLGIYTTIYFETLYIYCKFINGPRIIVYNLL